MTVYEAPVLIAVRNWEAVRKIVSSVSQTLPSKAVVVSSLQPVDHLSLQLAVT